MNTDQKYLNEKQVAEMTGLALSTLRNMRFNRRGPIYRKIGEKSVRYLLQDIISYMDTNIIKTDPDY